MRRPWMRRNGRLGATLATVAAFLTAWPGTGRASDRRGQPIVQAVEKARPSVVSISSEKKAASASRWPFSPEESQRSRVSGMGTGVLIDPRGFILTNQHVIDRVQGVEVRLADGSTYPARIVQQDKVADVAVLKVDAGRPLPAATVGISADLMLGEEVITIGNAFGYEDTISRGIISQLHRNVTLSDEQVYRNLIQTDAGINPGNSGGPLINIDGEVIGINVATRSGAQGIGFALPIDDVKRVAARMLSTRTLAGTWHGMVAEESQGEGGRSLVVAAVESGSPAESAGVRPGDQLVKIADLPVANVIDVERALLDKQPGQRAEVLVRRGGQEQALALEVQPLQRGPLDAADRVFRALGVRTTHAPAEYVASATNPRGKLRGGLYVVSVVPNSPADRAAIKKGDILVALNVGERNWETLRPDNVLYILKQSETTRVPRLRFWVVRNRILVPGDLDLSGGAVANAATR